MDCCTCQLYLRGGGFHVCIAATDKKQEMILAQSAAIFRLDTLQKSFA